MQATSTISPPHLLLPLLHRAAQLGSLSSIKHLASIYCFGITRGTAPVVTLVPRDAKRAVRWALEGCKRAVGKASGEGKAPLIGEEREITEELVHLLARLARSRVADWPGVGVTKEAHAEKHAGKDFWQSLEGYLLLLKEKLGSSTREADPVLSGSGSKAEDATGAVETDEVQDEQDEQPAASSPTTALSPATILNAELGFLEALLQLRQILQKRDHAAGMHDLLERLVALPEVEPVREAAQALLAAPEDQAAIKAFRQALWDSLPEEEEAESLLSTSSTVDQKQTLQHSSSFSRTLHHKFSANLAAITASHATALSLHKRSIHSSSSTRKAERHKRMHTSTRLHRLLAFAPSALRGVTARRNRSSKMRRSLFVGLGDLRVFSPTRPVSCSLSTVHRTNPLAPRAHRSRANVQSPARVSAIAVESHRCMAR
jgi:hypothetical protein